MFGDPPDIRFKTDSLTKNRLRAKTDLKKIKFLPFDRFPDMYPTAKAEKQTGQSVY